MASIMMMASPTPSVAEIAPLPCTIGLPSITLLGTRKDWKNLRQKLKRLKEFGDEPADNAHDLITIFLRLGVQIFPGPQQPQNHQFWNHIFISPCRISQKRESPDEKTAFITVIHRATCFRTTKCHNLT